MCRSPGMEVLPVPTFIMASSLFELILKWIEGCVTNNLNCKLGFSSKLQSKRMSYPGSHCSRSHSSVGFAIVWLKTMSFTKDMLLRKLHSGFQTMDIQKFRNFLLSNLKLICQPRLRCQLLKQQVHGKNMGQKFMTVSVQENLTEQSRSRCKCIVQDCPRRTVAASDFPVVDEYLWM